MSATAKANVTKPERIRAWLKDNPDGGRASQIAGALKISTTEACTALHDMHATGELVRCKVEIPGGRAEYHYRFSATAGSPRHGQPWRTMTATSGPKPPRPEPTTRPRGEVPYPPKPASAPATVLPTLQAAPVVVQEPVVSTQNSVPSLAPVEQDSSPPSSSAGEAARGAPSPAAATGAESFTATSLVEAIIELDEAIAPAKAQASSDWEPEPTPEPPPPMQPRFGLFSDGTLILENLPNLPPIIAIRREHTRALVDYLRAVDQ